MWLPILKIVHLSVFIFVFVYGLVRKTDREEERNEINILIHMPVCYRVIFSFTTQSTRTVLGNVKKFFGTLKTILIRCGLSKRN